MKNQDFNQMTVNFLKGLVIDGVNNVGSGHPGGAMSSMDFAYLLWTEFLHWHPEDPNHFARDRFVLSAGHESMLLYALLYASDILTIRDLQTFRQLGSQTPGHPEYGITPYVECTTGPLGQGAAMSVGMATSALHLSAQLDQKLFSYKTWCLLGDGCMQEEVTMGAAALAGHLGLHNLIWFYDKNDAQISGTRDRMATDDPARVFAGFGWTVHTITDGHDHNQLQLAMTKAKVENNRPTLIIATTKIAKGAYSVEGFHTTHGSPFSQEERRATKNLFSIPEGEDFYFPQEIKTHFQRNFTQLKANAEQQKALLVNRLKSSSFSQKYDSYFTPKVPAPLTVSTSNKPLATRASFGKVLEAWCDYPYIIGGSADLEPSNMTSGFAKEVKDFTKNNRVGRNIPYGVREFTMACVSNGIALHGGFVPFCATFLVFSDYMRAAIRLAALQKLTVLFQFTHDSFYVGEDGPTHQPVEHLMSLRLIPGLNVMRPADSEECEALMREALVQKKPSALVLTRQKVSPLSALLSELGSGYGEKSRQGAWVVRDKSHPSHVIYASGSEVVLALQVADILEQDSHFATQPEIKVVSMPCFELFAEQPDAYQAAVLSKECPRRISIEAGRTLGWQIFTGDNGLNVGVDEFGHSANSDDLAKFLGFTADKIADKIKHHAFSVEGE